MRQPRKEQSKHGSDETREDLGWLARNGIPGGHGEDISQVRMAHDPLADDAIERLESAVSAIGRSHSSELAAEVFDELVAEIAEVVTVVGQEQVNLLLAALDDARAKVVAAINGSPPTHNADMESIASPSSQPSTSETPAKTSEIRSLF